MMTDKELKSAMNFILTQGGRVPHPDTRRYKSTKSDKRTRNDRPSPEITAEELDRRAMAAARARYDAMLAEERRARKIDGFPWETGIYTINFEGAGISAAQTKYDGFLKSMKKRPDFKVLHQNFTEFFNGVSIFVTYSV